jgi:nucleotide-binding universal stress UspA family protein
MLVAVDGSEFGDYALNLAMQIAERYSATIYLLHVVTSRPTLAPIINQTRSAQGMHQIESEIGLDNRHSGASGDQDEVLIQRKRLVETRNISCEATSVRSDNIGGEIVRESSNADIVVIGSRGLSGIRSLILGSVSKKVAREAKSSVLIVKTKIDSLPRILLAYDGSAEGKKALELTMDLASKFKAEVSVIGVVSMPVSPEAYVVSDFDRWEREMRGYIEDAVKSLRDKGINSESRIATFVDVPRAISEEISTGAYHLVILGSRGSGRIKSLLLGSVAAGVADSAKTNVLVVR